MFEYGDITHHRTWAYISLGVCFVAVYFWQKRHFYYYASKIPGPFSLPVLGTLQLIWGKGFYNTILEIVKSYPSVSKFWIGSHLCVSLSRPQDIEIILSKFLNKGRTYKYFVDQVKNSLVPAPVDIWKPNRRLLNHSFTPNIINSHHGIFVKYSLKINEVLESLVGEEQTDIMVKLWVVLFGSVFETLMGLSPPSSDKVKKLILQTMRLEEIMMKRIKHFWLCLDPIWKLSRLSREAEILKTETTNFAREIIDSKIELLKQTKSANTSNSKNGNNIKTNNVFECLINALQNKNITQEQMIEEISLMLTAANETTASSVTCIMLTLGLNPHLQEIVYKEIISIIGENDEEITIEDLNKMEYLERFIKETIRLLPPIALISRSVDKDVYLASSVIPAGSEVFIPITNVHRNPEVWPDPLKFDPDRFSPEEVSKRHRCAYIPFSIGVRNCIGYKYALTQIKSVLPNIIRNFKFTTTRCTSIEDIDFEYFVVSKPKNYGILIEKRRKSTPANGA